MSSQPVHGRTALEAARKDPSVPWSVRVPLTALAEIVLCLEAFEQEYKGAGGALRSAIEGFAYLMRSHLGLNAVTTQEEAYRLLDARGLLPNSRNLKKIQARLQEEALRLDDFVVDRAMGGRTDIMDGVERFQRQREQEQEHINLAPIPPSYSEADLDIFREAQGGTQGIAGPLPGDIREEDDGH